MLMKINKPSATIIKTKFGKKAMFNIYYTSKKWNVKKLSDYKLRYISLHYAKYTTNQF